MPQDKSKKKQMAQVSRKAKSKLAATVIHLITDYRLLITALVPALTSCMGIYEEGFDCPPGKGVGCKSISEVNAMVNRGLLPKPNRDLDSALQLDSPSDQQFSHASASETEEDASSCKNCSGSHTSLSSHKRRSSGLSIWWAPQQGREVKESTPENTHPLNLLPQKGV